MLSLGLGGDPSNCITESTPLDGLVTREKMVFVRWSCPTPLASNGTDLLPPPKMWKTEESVYEPSTSRGRHLYLFLLTSETLYFGECSQREHRGDSEHAHLVALSKSTLSWAC